MNLDFALLVRVEKQWVDALPDLGVETLVLL